jgi:hypothetical protein
MFNEYRSVKVRTWCNKKYPHITCFQVTFSWGIFTNLELFFGKIDGEFIETSVSSINGKKLEVDVKNKWVAKAIKIILASFD